MSKMPFEKTQLGDMGQLYRGDCLGVMKRLPCNSVDAIVTDPP